MSGTFGRRRNHGTPPRGGARRLNTPASYASQSSNIQTKRKNNTQHQEVRPGCLAYDGINAADLRPTGHRHLPINGSRLHRNFLATASDLTQIIPSIIDQAMVATEIFNGPPQRFVVGNLFDIDPKKPVQSLCELSKQYNGAMRVRILNSPTVYFLTSQELVAEVCDESRFDKRLHTVLQNVRPLGGDGLFTAETAHPDWGKAHRVLMPVFGPAALRNMFPGMLDIAEQLMLKWERLGPETPLEVSDNMTRLTLDAIALCAFNYRFNSFYKDNMHPFVDAMVRALLEAGNRGRRLPIANWLRDQMDDQNRKDLGLLRSISDGLIDERKAKIASGATVPDDILNVMLNATDPKTGERLSEANVRDQMVSRVFPQVVIDSDVLCFLFCTDNFLDCRTRDDLGYVARS